MPTYWIILGLILLSIVSIAFGVVSGRKLRKAFWGLTEVTDEGPQRGAIPILGGSTLRGHYHGRRLELSMGSVNEMPILTFRLSCSMPPVFTADRCSTPFGLSREMRGSAVGLPDSCGFLLERKSWLPRQILGINLGGGTGLPVVPSGESGFDSSYCLSTSEPAREAVLGWMRHPGTREGIELLFSKENLALLTPTVSGKEGTSLAAVVRNFQDANLEPVNVRSVLDHLEAIAKSLETRDQWVPIEGAVFSPVVYCLTCGHAVVDAERSCPNCGTKPSKPPTPSPK